MNKDKRNNIKLLGTLNNTDESGIIANANQIYDANENKSTQDVSKEHTERIKTLETKENSMQTTLENITKTGEASAASNVTYNHSDSKIDATNVQQAIDEVSSIGHFAKKGGIVNISTNYNSDHIAEVLTLSQAIAKVPSSDRVLGFQGTFLSKDGWINYRFIGSDISEWNDSTKWVTDLDFFDRFVFTNNATINSILKEIYIDFTGCKINADTTRVKLHAIKKDYVGEYSVAVKVYNRDSASYVEGGAFMSSSSYNEDSVLSGISSALGIKIYAIVDWSKVDGVIKSINKDLIYPMYLNLSFSPSIYSYILDDYSLNSFYLNNKVNIEIESVRGKNKQVALNRVTKETAGILAAEDFSALQDSKRILYKSALSKNKNIIKELYIDYSNASITIDKSKTKLHTIGRRYEKPSVYNISLLVYNTDTSSYVESGIYVPSQNYNESDVLKGITRLGIKIYAIVDWSLIEDGTRIPLGEFIDESISTNIKNSPVLQSYFKIEPISSSFYPDIAINTWVSGKYINIDNTVENVKDLVENPIDNDKYSYIIQEIKPGDVISVPRITAGANISVICFTDSLFNVLDRRCARYNSVGYKENFNYILPPTGSAYLIINTDSNVNPVNLLGRGGRALSISNRYTTNSFKIAPTVLKGYQLGQNGELLDLSSTSKSVCINSYSVSKIREIFVELHRTYIDTVYTGDTLDYAFYDKNGEAIKLGNIIKGGYIIGKTMVLQVPKNAVFFKTSSHISDSNSGINKVFGVVNYSEYSEYEQNKNVLYVSSSLGNDNWDGRTFDRPLKSLNVAVNSCPSGGTVLLKCGDIFYIESALSLNNKNIASYSNGKKPIISHFRVLSDFSSNPFERASNIGDNIWKISMANTNFQGGVPYNTTYSDIGFIYDRYNDLIAFGHRVNCFTLEEMESLQDSNPQRKSYLKENGDFLQRDSDTIYLYYTGDLNADFRTLEFACKGNCINAAHSEIKNIKIEGFGSHGIATTGDRQNIYIHNVNIDLIGGSCQSTYPIGKDFGRFGNGIEFWIDINNPSKNIRVENCRISRTFDTGTTIQGYMVTDDEVPNGVYAENIVIEHNVFIKCRQAYECFCRKRNSSGINYADYPLKECYFKNNISISPGDNEFNSPETRDTHFLSGSLGMKIQGNTLFDGGMNFTRGYYMEFLRGNVCYIREGDIMYSNNDKNTVVYPTEKDESTWIEGSISYSDAVEKAILKYRELLGDKYTTFIRLTDTLYNEMYSILSNII